MAEDSVVKKIITEFTGFDVCKKAKDFICGPANTGSLSSWLHHSITVGLLFGCCVLIYSHQYFGAPIQCLRATLGPDPYNADAINSFCFISSTFSVIDGLANENATSKDLTNLYPGIGPVTDHKKVRHHAYYQWVPFVLLGQMLLFMVPYGLWQYWEGGLVANMISALTEDIESRDCLPEKKEPIAVRKLAKYFYRRILERQSNFFLGVMWVFCDFLALFNIFFNFYLTDILLGGYFRNYGHHVLHWLSTRGGRGPFEISSVVFFPILTKCTFHLFGKSGSLQTVDNMCIISLNLVNERVFLILWYWFYILGVWTVIDMILRMGHLTMLKYYSKKYWNSTIGNPVQITDESLGMCTALMHFGDLVMLFILTKNMRPLTYKAFIRSLAKHIDKEEKKPVHLQYGWRSPTRNNEVGK